MDGHKKGIQLKCNIIVPVYNEKDTILGIINSVKFVKIDKEIIVVDDFSTDGTREILRNLEDVKVIYHNRNKGKGTAIRTALKHITGDIVIIQDADFEYDPNDYPRLIKPITEGKTEVVYGSRFKGNGNFLPMSFLANKFLTFLTNFLYGSRISDMCTCYKCLKMDVIKKLNLKAKRFEIDPEITSKLLKSRYRIYEVPISYSGRRKNKKIGFRDGVQAVWCLFKYRLFN